MSSGDLSRLLVGFRPWRAGIHEKINFQIGGRIVSENLKEYYKGISSD
jgi:hypothetical protein